MVKGKFTGMRIFNGELMALHADQIKTKSTAQEMVKFLKSEGHNARVTKLEGKYAVWMGKRKWGKSRWGI